MQIIKKYFGSIEWFFISIFIVLMPFIFSKKLMDPSLYSRQLIFSLLLIIVGIFLLFKIKKQQIIFNFNIFQKIFFTLTLLFFITHIVSCINVINIKEAVLHTLKEGSLLVYLFLSFLLLKNYKIGYNLLIKSIILSTLLFLIIGIVQLLKSDFSIFTNATDYYDYYLTQALANVKSTLANKNPFASFLYLSLPYTIYGTLIFKKTWRIISAITNIISLMFVALLMSRTVWIATILFFVLIFIFTVFYLFYLRKRLYNKTLKPILKVVILLIPILLILGTLITLKNTNLKATTIIKGKFNQIINTKTALSTKNDNPTSFETRLLAWHNSYKMIKEKPLLGVGPGQWRMWLPKYGLDRFDNKIRQGVNHFQRPHNDFLWIGSETGILGLLIYTLIYLLALIIAIKNFITTKCKKYRLLNGLLFSSLIGYLIILSISFSRERIPHNLAYLSMFALIIYNTNEFTKNKKKNNENNKPLLLIASLLFFVLIILNLSFTYKTYKGEKELKKLLYFKNKRKNWQAVLKISNKMEKSLYTIDVFAMPIMYYKGTAEYSLNKLQNANKSFEKAYKLHPNNIIIINNLATSYDLLGKPDKALELYKKALDISPRYVDALINISIIYYNKNDIDKAFDNIAKIPYKHDYMERYYKALLTISKQYAIKYQDMFDLEKLKNWIADDDKIKSSVVEFQKKNTIFYNFLKNELKK